jgi:hypothetical protein
VRSGVIPQELLVVKQILAFFFIIMQRLSIAENVVVVVGRLKSRLTSLHIA